MTRLPVPGPGRPHHPAMFREPPTERQLEQARRAREGLRHFNRFGLRRASKGRRAR